MKRLGLIWYFIITCLILNAQNIKKEEIEKVAINFFSSKSKGIGLIIKEYQINDTVLFYLAHNQKDFIIICNELGINPIIGYSDEGTYDGENIPPQLVNLLESFKKEILELKRGLVKSERSYQKEWNTYLNNDFTHIKSSVLPIIKVNWNQGSGWNKYCPEDTNGPGGHVYAGCVAVSMAQSMSVYKHPNIGVGSSSYYAEGYGLQMANYGETEYNWNLMSNTSADDYNSLLLYHCAVSVNMGFGADGSGAYTRDIANALKSYFDYSSDVYWKSSTEDQAWINLLKSELDAGRPISYGGNNGVDEGHAFNLDGYNSSDAFHVNWGWSGAYNGYFQIMSLTPGSNDFSKNAVAVLNIKPKDHSPTDIKLSTYSIVEKLPIGSSLATIIVTDVDENDVHDISVDFSKPISAFPTCPFYADGDTLKNSIVIENETLPNAEIVITAKDLQGNEFSKILVIDILKENYPPTNINLSNLAIIDTIEMGSFVGKFSTTDQDAVDTFTYTFETNINPLIGADNNKFLIRNDSLITNYNFNSFDKNSCSIYVKSADKRDESVTKEFVITINKSTGIFNQSIESSLKIYPNPSSTGEFVINLPKQLVNNKCIVSIYNMNGSLKQTFICNTDQNNISVKINEHGMYLVKLLIDNNLYSSIILYK